MIKEGREGHSAPCMKNHISMRTQKERMMIRGGKERRYRIDDNLFSRNYALREVVSVGSLDNMDA